MFGLFALTCFLTVSIHMAVAQDLVSLGNRGAEAAYALDEIMTMPDKTIPDSIFKASHCIVVIPGVVKVGLIVGGQHGRGLISCRVEGGWSRPSFVSIAAGSVGLQIGAQATDFVLVVVNESTARILSSHYIVLGQDASISAGPVGHTLEMMVDATGASEIYSYSRTRGLFVGLSLEGASLRVDEDANKSVYDGVADANDLLFEVDGSVPAEVAPFLRALQRHDPAGTQVSAVGGLIE